jgi:hypothetical protein
MAVANTDLTQGSALTTSTDGKYTVTGTGIFDDLMEAVNIHLDAQFQLGRITGADYATVYLGAMQSALQNSASFTLGKEKTNAESTLIAQKEITEYAQTQQTTKVAPHADSLSGKQAVLYGEQAKGFQWNADQKYLKTLLDAWAININTAGVASTNITALNATGTGNMNTQITNAEPTG